MVPECTAAWRLLEANVFLKAQHGYCLQKHQTFEVLLIINYQLSIINLKV